MAYCASCGKDTSERARFCSACGARLVTPSAEAEERKVVTVLFCDMVGSTARADGADPEDVQATLDIYYQRLRVELERYGATLEKFIGDAVMAVFGAPIAHEDDAERAVRAGLRILEAVAELNAARPGLDLVVRIGVATGEVLVRLGAGPELGMVVGDVVNIAARIETAAPPGGLLVADATFRLTRNQIEYSALDPVSVKGKADPLPVWLAISPRARTSAEVAAAATTPFVGRVDELAALHAAFSRAVGDRSVQLVTITGEPGAGKSRLVRELFAFVDNSPKLVRWRQGRCLPYGEGITFWALGEIVKAEAGILESDDEALARAKLTAAVDALISEGRAWLLTRLAPLVGLTGQTNTEPTTQTESFTAWRHFLEAAAGDAPLVLVVEDAHWADPILLAFIDYLVDWAEGVALLVVVTARPELFTVASTWGGGKRNATTLALSPLSDAETAQLLSALGAALLPAEVQAALLEAAGGNPLYAEQFVRLLNEQGLPSTRGRVIELSAATGLPKPDTLTAIVAARLDTLAGPAKALLADAAVLGRVFWSGGLSALGSRSDEEVRLALRELSRAEFVRRITRSSMAGQDEYAFWHVLLCEVAYAMLPRRERATKHIAAAAWLEQRIGDRVADQAEILAHHYLTALELKLDFGDQAGADALARPAGRYLAIAADRTSELEPEVAARQYRRVVELLPPADSDRPGVLVKFGRNCIRRGQLAQAEPLFREALATFESHHDIDIAARAATGLASLARSRGDLLEAERLDQHAISILEKGPPGEALAHAFANRALDLAQDGNPEEAISLTDKILALGEASRDWKSQALSVRGFARLSMDDVRGIEDAREAVRVAKSVGTPGVLSNALAILGELEWITQGPQVGLASYQEGIQVAQRCGDLRYGAITGAESVRVLFDLGDWEELLARWAKVRQQLEIQGNKFTLAEIEPYRAAVLAWRGLLPAAKASVDSVSATARAIASLRALTPALSVAALVEQASGHEVAALNLVEEYRSALTAKTGRVGWYWGEWFLADLVRLCVAAGAVEVAEGLVGDTQPAALRQRLSVLTARACVAEARNDFDSALSLYADATQGWQSYGHVLEHGQALLGEGRCRLQFQLTGAEAPLRQARQLFSRLHAEPLMTETDRWLSQSVAQTS